MPSFAFSTSRTPAGLLLMALMPSIMAGCAGGGQSVRAPIQPAKSAPAITAIPACDAYLDSYLKCHRAAAIYPAEALPSHYQAMRQSLLDAAQDPQAHPLLEQRCLMLRRQITDLLGKSC